MTTLLVKPRWEIRWDPLMEPSGPDDKKMVEGFQILLPFPKYSKTSFIKRWFPGGTLIDLKIFVYYIYMERTEVEEINEMLRNASPYEIQMLFKHRDTLLAGITLFRREIDYDTSNTYFRGVQDGIIQFVK